MELVHVVTEEYFIGLTSLRPSNLAQVDDHLRLLELDLLGIYDEHKLELLEPFKVLKSRFLRFFRRLECKFQKSLQLLKSEVQLFLGDFDTSIDELLKQFKDFRQYVSESYGLNSGLFPDKRKSYLQSNISFISEAKACGDLLNAVIETLLGLSVS